MGKGWTEIARPQGMLFEVRVRMAKENTNYSTL